MRVQGAGGLQTVTTDSTLTGSGTPASPLHVVSTGSFLTSLGTHAAVIGTGTTAAAAAPSGLVVGGIIFQQIYWNTNATAPTATGWTNATGVITMAGGSTQYTAVYYHLATTGETPATTWTFTFGASVTSGLIPSGYSGCHQTTPVDSNFFNLSGTGAKTSLATNSQAFGAALGNQFAPVHFFFAQSASATTFTLPGAIYNPGADANNSTYASCISSPVVAGAIFTQPLTISVSGGITGGNPNWAASTLLVNHP